MPLLYDDMIKRKNAEKYQIAAQEAARKVAGILGNAADKPAEWATSIANRVIPAAHDAQQRWAEFKQPVQQTIDAVIPGAPMVRQAWKEEIKPAMIERGIGMLAGPEYRANKQADKDAARAREYVEAQTEGSLAIRKAEAEREDALRAKDEAELLSSLGGDPAAVAEYKKNKLLLPQLSTQSDISYKEWLQAPGARMHYGTGKGANAESKQISMAEKRFESLNDDFGAYDADAIDGKLTPEQARTMKVNRLRNAYRGAVLGKYNTNDYMANLEALAAEMGTSLQDIVNPPPMYGPPRPGGR